MSDVTELTTVDEDYTAVTTDGTVVADSTAGAVTVTLPAASEMEGRTLIVKRIPTSANNVTVEADGTDTIDDGTDFVLTASYDSLTLRAVSGGWIVTSYYTP